MQTSLNASLVNSPSRVYPRVMIARLPPSERRDRSWRRQAAIDFSSPDTWFGIGAAVIGLALGVGFPVFMISRDDMDEERVEAIRELNRETYEATGEYLSKEELEKMRSPRWMDRREYKDED